MEAIRNPFRSSLVAEIRYRISADDLDGLIGRLRSNGWCGAIRGPHGTGKTTLMEDLEPHLKKEGLKTQWIRLNSDSTARDKREASSKIRASGKNVCWLIDGGEVLGQAKLLRLRLHAHRIGCGLIATTHGITPLPTAIRTRPDHGIILQLAERLAGNHWNPEMAAIASNAHIKSQGNAREVFRACYLYCSRIKAF